MPIVFSWFICIKASNPNSPTSYIKSNVIPTCNGANKVCGIYAQVDVNNKPLITQSLHDEIIMALNNATSSTNAILNN